MPSSQVVGAGTKTSVSERQEVACRLLGLRGEPCSLGSERQEVECRLLGLGRAALFTGFRETGSSMLAPGAGGGSPVHWGQAFSLER